MIVTKKISLTPIEYIQFCEIAEKYNLTYSSFVQPGIAIVEADADILESWGY